MLTSKDETSTSHSSHSHNDALKVTGIDQLKSSGVESNYLDWSFVVQLHLQACRVGHVIEVSPGRDTPPHWVEDNITVCSVITKTVHPSNPRHIRDHPNDARAMWLSLRAAHQDFTAGGRMYWLRKLVLYRIDDDDVEKHLEAMNIIYKRLNSLVTTSNPLTADNIFAKALLILVPPSWLHSIPHLLNSPKTTSSEIFSCLKAKSNRRVSTADNPSAYVSASRASTGHGR